MFTRLRLPRFSLASDWAKDGPLVVKWISDYFLSLEQKNALTLGQAQIYVDQGLQFPATQVASTDPNNLDDYKEGTWTPSDGSGAALSLTVTAATYTKVGRLVSGLCHVTYPVTASGAAARINGLPYTTPNTNSAPLFTSGAGGGTVAQISGTNLQPFAPGAVAITNANLSGVFVIIRFQYEV